MDKVTARDKRRWKLGVGGRSQKARLLKGGVAGWGCYGGWGWRRVSRAREAPLRLGGWARTPAPGAACPGAPPYARSPAHR